MDFESHRSLVRSDSPGFKAAILDARIVFLVIIQLVCIGRRFCDDVHLESDVLANCVHIEAITQFEIDSEICRLLMAGSSSALELLLEGLSRRSADLKWNTSALSGLEHAHVDFLWDSKRVLAACIDQVCVEGPSDCARVLNDQLLLYPVLRRQLYRLSDLEANDLHLESLLHFAETDVLLHDLVERWHREPGLDALGDREKLGSFG